MTRDLEYNITAQDNGVTISDYLKKQGFSHAVIVQLMKPCQGSPLPVPRYWIISKPFPTDCCSGEV